MDIQLCMNYNDFFGQDDKASLLYYAVVLMILPAIKLLCMIFVLHTVDNNVLNK